MSCTQERAQAEDLNKKLKEQSANFRVPDVMEYVEAKATNDQLSQTIKSLERKVRIAKVRLKDQAWFIKVSQSDNHLESLLIHN